MVAELISPYAFKGPKGAWNGSPPVGYSLSMNLIGSFGQIGSAGGSLLFGRLADKIGAKMDATQQDDCGSFYEAGRQGERSTADGMFEDSFSVVVLFT